MCELRHTKLIGKKDSLKSYRIYKFFLVEVLWGGKRKEGKMGEGGVTLCCPAFHSSSRDSSAVLYGSPLFLPRKVSEVLAFITNIHDSF